MGNELTSAPKSKWRDQRPALPDRILGHPYSAAHVLRFMMTGTPTSYTQQVNGSTLWTDSKRRKDPWHRLSARPMTPGPPSARIPVIRCLLRPARPHSLTHSLTQNRTLRSIPVRRSHHRLFAHPPPTRTPKADSALPSFQSCFYSLTKANEPPPGSLTQASDRPRQVASSQPLLASSGALQNITALLPTTLQVYLDKSIASLAKAIANYSGYISDTTGIDPNLILYSTIGCILLAVPFTMSRYGWSTNREQISPYGSTLSGVPDVTDEDFSYITTEDLQSTSLGSSVPTRSYAHNPRSRGSVPDDDILLIKNKGITYPAHFPAYAIGDGKLRVRDVRDRVSVLLELSERRGRRVKLLYKGRQLKEPAAPVRDYGVKNNSEVMVVLPEGEVDAESSDDSDEEMVVVGGDGGSAVGSNGGTDDGKKRRGKKKGRKSKKRSSNTSPRDSASNLGVPGQERQSSPSLSKANGPHAKLDAIAAKFEADLRQPCEDYIASPPTDPKKREEEHRKLSETTMQHVLLKLDEVETEGDQDARMKRKALVQTVQDVLKRLDARLKA
ncbi:BAG domain-containing protein [Colletotrichum simmondsii]|uniref:BAG domain-containing protein n=1 Tax=Colletotrichum simmondsii TaxID=703756 RepID=A0A135SIB9_9PEZI|nr:BAG domain-containing protein [Colletotrichum simmondsii]